MVQKQPKQSKSGRDYEQLGHLLEEIYLHGYVSRKEMFKMTFLKGVVGGLGGVLGATIVLALLLWILSLFEQVPLVGPLFDNVQDTVQTQKQ